MFLTLQKQFTIKYLKTGQLTGIYMIWYSIGRFFIEQLRMDSLMLGNFKVAQIVSILMIICGVGLIIYRNKGNRFDNLYRKGLTDEIRF